MKRLRKLRRLVLLFVLFLCATYIALTVYSSVQLRRAQTLITQVSAARLGVPFVGQSVAANLGETKCDPKFGCTHEASFSNLPFAEVLQAHRLEVPNIMRPKWWSVGAAIEVDANGISVRKSVFVDDGKYHQYPTLWLTIRDEPRLFDPCFLRGQSRHPGYRSLREMRSGALYVNASPFADARLLQRAFNLRLDCLNTIRGCKTPGDIAPEQWQDQIDDVKFAEAHPDELMNSKCRVPYHDN